MCLYRGRDKYLGEDVLHGHDKALPVVQAEFVIRVTATGEHAADVCQEHGAVDAAEHVPDHHRLLYHHFLWLAATYHKDTNIPCTCNPIYVKDKVVLIKLKKHNW